MQSPPVSEADAHRHPQDKGDSADLESTAGTFLVSGKFLGDFKYLTIASQSCCSDSGFLSRSP